MRGDGDSAADMKKGCRRRKLGGLTGLTEEERKE